MKRFSILLSLVILLGSFVPANAVEFDVEIDPTKAFIHPDAPFGTYYMGGTPMYLDIKMSNNSGSDILGFSQTLKFYSPTGGNLVWQAGGATPDGSVVRMNGWEDDTYWNLANDITLFDWDGILPDTMNHTVVGSWMDGDPMQTRLRFYFTVPTAGFDQATDIVEICVDQSNASDPTYDWLFPDGSQFGGPYCIQCLSVPCCTQPIIESIPLSLSTNHDVPFNVTSGIYSPLGFDITGVEAIDENDNPIGTASLIGGNLHWFFDPPCSWIDDGLEHTARFYAETVGHTYPDVSLSSRVSLTVTEGGAPEFIENYQSDILARIGETEEVTIEMDDPGYDDETWAYTVSDMTTGDIFFDNGYLSFTPNEDDDGTIFLFTVSATDCLEGADEAKVYYWARSEVLCGDTRYDSEINILDAVLLINILYKFDMTPGPLEINDVDNSGSVNILDVVYIINFKYKGGPAPNCPVSE